MRFNEILGETIERQPAEILVVVHPDSACGSANWNLGDDTAQAARQTLSADLARWQGGVIVLTGEDAGDLRKPAYGSLRQALTGALQQARAGNQIAIQQRAPDPSQVPVLQKIIRSAGLQPTTMQFAVTGAWYHTSDRTGCVGDVKDALEAAGFIVRLLPSALDFDAA